MTNKTFNRIATVIFYIAGAIAVGVVFISWNESDIPPAAEPLSKTVESISKSEAVNPLPINDREPQNFAQPTVNSNSDH
jgi:hypothetical protein